MYIKKLIGASLIKCNYFTYMLQTLVGLNLRNDEMGILKQNLEGVQSTIRERSMMPVDMALSTINDSFVTSGRTNDETVKELAAGCRHYSSKEEEKMYKGMGLPIPGQPEIKPKQV